MLHSNTITIISPALLKAQKAMGGAVKGSKNPFFKSSYSDLNSVREAVMPALHDNGISAIQPTVYVGGKQFVQTTLLHESGEFIASLTEVVCSKQNDPQAMGSAISYARRYSLMSLMNVGAVDDDGESAMDRPTLSKKVAPAAVKPEGAAPASFKPTKKEAAPAAQTPGDESDGW